MAQAPSGGTFEVRLPCRAEHLQVTKRVVVYEEVVIRLNTVTDRYEIQATVKRERLTTATEDSKKRT